MVKLVLFNVVLVKVTEPLDDIERGFTIIKNFNLQMISGLVQCLKNSVNLFPKDSECHVSSNTDNSPTPKVS